MPRTLADFPPLGIVITIIYGASVAERTGLFSTAIRGALLNAPRFILTPIVVITGMVSHHASDASYVVVIPLAAVIFAAAGRHPLAGLAAGFAAVSGGYAGNLFPGASDALILGGQNSRTNAFLVDGIRQGDDFGLSPNGYPTVNSPISISVLEAVQVDVAPYDVQYGAFQGGVVNSVTKSGGNEFHGEAFYEITNQDLQGDSFSYEDMSSGETINRSVTGEFEEKTWGATLSGPIIKDRLFFLLNYEKFEATEPVLSGPTGSGATNEVPGITQADVDSVRNAV
ncbi:hypothetical protein LTR94_028680, partial [Friedmanniomyces endolithicus]